jgi:hypothetical protein
MENPDMRTFLRGKVRLLFVAFAVMLAVPAIALADNIVNDIDTTVHADSVVNATVGETVRVGYLIQATGQICDAADGTKATLTPSKDSGPGTVAISPTSQDYTACDSSKTFDFSADTPGDYVIAVAVADTNGDYNTTTGRWKLRVTGGTTNPPADTTPPIISYQLNPPSPDGANGWYKSNVSLTWTVTENESPSSLQTTGCVDQNITADQVATTYSCSATSDGGSAGPVNVSIKRDAAAPLLNIAGAASGTAYNYCDAAPTSPTFDPYDETSGLDGSEDDTWTAPTNGAGTYTYTAHAQDLAGNAASETRTYTRTYGAAYKGLQQPINAGSTPRSVFKLGSTVPLKFFLACPSGPVTNANATFSITKVDSMPDGSVNESPVDLPASSGNQFRLADATSGQYIFNLSTKPLTQGTYNLKVNLGDGSDPLVTQVMFDLKK